MRQIYLLISKITNLFCLSIFLLNVSHNFEKEQNFLDI